MSSFQRESSGGSCEESIYASMDASNFSRDSYICMGQDSQDVHIINRKGISMCDHPTLLCTVLTDDDRRIPLYNVEGKSEHNERGIHMEWLAPGIYYDGFTHGFIGIGDDENDVRLRDPTAIDDILYCVTDHMKSTTTDSEYSMSFSKGTASVNRPKEASCQTVSQTDSYIMI